MILTRHYHALLVIACGLIQTAPSFAANPPELAVGSGGLIDVFFSPPEFVNVQLSPAGSHLAFLREVDGRHILATYDFKTRKTAIAQPPPGRRVASYDWVAPDRLLFLYIQDQLKRERPLDFDLRHEEVNIRNLYLGHYVADSSLKRAEPMPNLQVIYEMVDPLPHNPSCTYLTEQSHDNFYGPLYRYDPSRNKIELQERNPGRLLYWHADNNGKVRVATFAEDAGQSTLHYRATEAATWERLNLPAHARFVAYAADGQYLLISHPDPATGRFVLQTYDLQKFQFVGESVSNPLCDIDPFPIRDPRTGVLWGLSYETDKEQFIWFAPQLRQIQATVAGAFPGAIVSPLGVTHSDQIVVAVYSDVLPLQYYSLDPKAGHLQLLLDSRPKVHQQRLSPMRPISFKSGDGTELHGYLTLPTSRPNARQLP